jgi:hypothetical protein
LRHGIHPMPVHSVPLATTPKRVKPVADDLGSEAPECVDVGRHGVVGEVASHDLAELNQTAVLSHTVPLVTDRAS